MYGQIGLYVLMIMKIKLLYIICMSLFFFSCFNKGTEHGYLDSITIKEYNNNYDNKGRLEQVIITTKHHSSIIGIKKVADKSVSKRLYTYMENGDYTIVELSGKNNREITNYSDKVEEVTRIESGTDTVYYRLWLMNNRNKISYIKRKQKNESFLSDFKNDDNYEIYYFYDEDENLTKVNRIDHSTGQTTETWWFNDITYEEATKRVVPSDNQTEIICLSIKSVGDTIIEQRFVNNSLVNFYKKYHDGKKYIEASYDAFGNLTFFFEEYEEDGFLVTVYKMNELNIIDSTFQKNGLEYKSIDISPEGKSIVETEYNDKGDIIRQEEKSWSFKKDRL